MNHTQRVRLNSKRKATEEDYNQALKLLSKKSTAFVGTNEHRKRIQLRMICLSYTNYVAINEAHFNALK